MTMLSAVMIGKNSQMMLFAIGLAASALFIIGRLIARVREARWQHWVMRVQNSVQQYASGVLMSVHENTAAEHEAQTAAEFAAAVIPEIFRMRQMKSSVIPDSRLSSECADAVAGLISADRDARRTQYVRMIGQPVAECVGFTAEGEQLRPVVRVLVRAREYAMDDATQKIVSGHSRKEVYRAYEIGLRQSGANYKVTLFRQMDLNARF